MISKLRTREQILSHFKDGQTIAIGGLANAFMPTELVDLLNESGVKHLTLLSLDGSDPGICISKLLESGQVDEMYTTHIGMNPIASKLMMEGKVKIHLLPIGTWAEKMRCLGAGLGGFLTQTGYGTVVGEGKQVITLNGKNYLLEEAFPQPDISLTRARRCDPMGNCTYHGSGATSHPQVAMAGKLSIVQPDLYCDFSEISIDDIKVPAMYIDEIYLPGKDNDEFPLLGPGKKARIMAARAKAVK